VVLTTSSASRLRVELARASSGHLVGDSLDVVVGARHDYVLMIWSFVEDVGVNVNFREDC
jgi:hypothetical protein